MKVSGWKNGRFDNPTVEYCIRIGVQNRDAYFRSEWRSVEIQFANGHSVDVPISDGFWKECPELRHPAFGEWFQAGRLIPWPHGSPTTIELIPVGPRRLRLN